MKTCKLCKEKIEGRGLKYCTHCAEIMRNRIKTRRCNEITAASVGKRVATTIGYTRMILGFNK